MQTPLQRLRSYRLLPALCLEFGDIGRYSHLSEARKHRASTEIPCAIPVAAKTVVLQPLPAAKPNWEYYPSPAGKIPVARTTNPYGRPTLKIHITHGGAAWSQGALSLPPQQPPPCQQAVPSLPASWLELKPAAPSVLLSRAGTSTTTGPGKQLGRAGAVALPEQ